MIFTEGGTAMLDRFSAAQIKAICTNATETGYTFYIPINFSICTLTFKVSYDSELSEYVARAGQMSDKDWTPLKVKAAETIFATLCEKFRDHYGVETILDITVEGSVDLLNTVFQPTIISPKRVQ